MDLTRRSHWCREVSAGRRARWGRARRRAGSPRRPCRRFHLPQPQCKANGRGAEECRSVITRRSVTVTQVSVKLTHHRFFTSTRAFCHDWESQSFGVGPFDRGRTNLYTRRARMKGKEGACAAAAFSSRLPKGSDDGETRPPPSCLKVAVGICAPVRRGLGGPDRQVMAPNRGPPPARSSWAVCTLGLGDLATS